MNSCTELVKSATLLLNVTLLIIKKSAIKIVYFSDSIIMCSNEESVLFDKDRVITTESS